METVSETESSAPAEPKPSDMESSPVNTEAGGCVATEPVNSEAKGNENPATSATALCGSNTPKAGELPAKSLKNLIPKTQDEFLTAVLWIFLIGIALLIIINVVL